MQTKKVLEKIAVYTLLILGTAIMLFPFFYMITTALKPQTFIFQIPPQLIPEQLTFKNFVNAWTSQNFGRFFFNSLIVATGTTVLSVTISSMMAFAFARFDFPGKTVLWWIIISALTVPWMLFLIPQFILARTLNLLNSLVGLILFYSAMNLSFNTFLIRSYLEPLPEELEDSAKIDGANLFTIFSRVIMPLATPALAATTIFTFVMAWDEFVISLTFLQSENLYTLPIAIQRFHGQHLTQWGLVFAATTIAVIPVIMIFVIFQRYFIKGVSTTGLK